MTSFGLFSIVQSLWIYGLLAKIGLKDAFQAKSTLQSIIENYENKDDDILTQAKEKLEKLKKNNTIKIKPNLGLIDPK